MTPSHQPQRTCSRRLLLVRVAVAMAVVPSAASASQAVKTGGIDSWWRERASACPEGTTLSGEAGKRIFCAGEDGKAHGRATTWHDNGSLGADGIYKADQENGFVRTWDTQGRPVMEAHYVEGVLEGRAILCGQRPNKIHWDGREGNRKLGWYANGGKAVEIIYGEAGKVIQEIRYCSKTAEINYKNGKEHGTAYAWHDNGQLASRSEFVDGLLEGEATTWHENGEKATVVHYVSGVLHGKSMSWYPNGRVESVGNFASGLKHGQWTHWYEQGKGSATMQWSNGERVDKNVVATSKP